MKIKFNARFFSLLLLAGAIAFLLNQCKNVGPSDWPEPTPEVNNQLKLSVFNSEDGTTLQDYSIKVIKPDGTVEEHNNQSGTLTIDGTMTGEYVLTASSNGYLAESSMIEVEPVEEENVSTVTQYQFYLSKRGEANVVTPQGTMITVETDLEQPATLEFPYGSLSNEENVTVSFIQPPAKNGNLKIYGERAILKGFNFSPDLTFPSNAKPVLTVPVNVQSIQEGKSPILLGTYDEETQTWETLEGSLNADKTLATFEMPHFSDWYAFTGYRLVKDSYSWAPWEFVAESDTCGSGACGTYIWAATPNALINELISFGYTINLKAKDTRCVGPHFLYAQQLYARVRLVTYKVYDYTGALQGTIQVPTSKFQWMVDEYYCHDQGGGS